LRTLPDKMKALQHYGFDKNLAKQMRKVDKMSLAQVEVLYWLVTSP
jgi:hypothetical protein